MATVDRFEDLETWKLAKILAEDVFAVYQASLALQRDFKLWHQMNGSSGSIMDNIAEGFERNSRDEFINFLSYAKGSSGELKSQLYRAESRKYITKAVFEDLYEKSDKVGRKIGSHMEYLKQCEYRGTKFKDRLQLPKSNPVSKKIQPNEKNTKRKK